MPKNHIFICLFSVFKLNICLIWKSNISVLTSEQNVVLPKPDHLKGSRHYGGVLTPWLSVALPHTCSFFGNECILLECRSFLALWLSSLIFFKSVQRGLCHQQSESTLPAFFPWLWLIPSYCQCSEASDSFSPHQMVPNIPRFLTFTWQKRFRKNQNEIYGFNNNPNRAVAVK